MSEFRSFAAVRGLDPELVLLVLKPWVAPEETREPENYVSDGCCHWSSRAILATFSAPLATSFL